jgi:hypothetical protein
MTEGGSLVLVLVAVEAVIPVLQGSYRSYLVDSEHAADPDAAAASSTAPHACSSGVVGIAVATEVDKVVEEAVARTYRAVAEA